VSNKTPVAPWYDEYCEDPIHAWFGLSYANYLVIPRTVLQSLSKETQLALLRALDLVADEEGKNMPEHWPGDANIEVKLKDPTTGRYMKDPLANYERGRRRLWREDE
jgi:hypothetical protein